MLICQNKKAGFLYFIEEKFTAGLVLTGWEIKSIRAKKAQIQEAHIRARNGELWVINMHITPLLSASTHVKTDNTRSRKLLLNCREMNKLIGKVERNGYTIVPLTLFIADSSYAKITIALARGKKIHDKRDAEKDRDWNRQKQRIMQIKNTSSS